MHIKHRRIGLPHAGRGHPPHVPAPPRRSRPPLVAGEPRGGRKRRLPLARSALYGLLRTGRGRGSWATAPRPGYRQYTCQGRVAGAGRAQGGWGWEGGVKLAGVWRPARVRVRSLRNFVHQHEPDLSFCLCLVPCSRRSGSRATLVF